MSWAQRCFFNCQLSFPVILHRRFPYSKIYWPTQWYCWLPWLSWCSWRQLPRCWTSASRGSSCLSVVFRRICCRGIPCTSFSIWGLCLEECFMRFIAFNCVWVLNFHWGSLFRRSLLRDCWRGLPFRPVLPGGVLAISDVFSWSCLPTPSSLHFLLRWFVFVFGYRSILSPICTFWGRRQSYRISIFPSCSKAPSCPCRSPPTAISCCWGSPTTASLFRRRLASPTRSGVFRCRIFTFYSTCRRLFVGGLRGSCSCCRIFCELPSGSGVRRLPRCCLSGLAIFSTSWGRDWWRRRGLHTWVIVKVLDGFVECVECR